MTASAADRPTSSAGPLLAWIALTACAGGTALYFVLGPQGWLVSWHYVATGVHALLSARPLDLYGRHPDLQIGPLTFVLSVPVELLPPLPRHVLATALLVGCGLLAVGELRRFVPAECERARRRWFLTGLLAVAAWSEVAVRYGHADDVLALLGVVLGLGLLRRSHPLLAGLLLGLAVDAKPWVLPCVALLVLAEPGRRVAALAVAAGVVVLAWAPFLLLGAGTIRAFEFRIPVEAASTLHLLGIRHGTPPWCRPAQMLLGTAAVVLVARRSRWQAALLVVVAIRMLLDPAAKPYYDAGLVLGAAAFDLFAAVPVATLIATAGVAIPSLLLTADPAERGVLRAITLLTLLVLGLLVPQRPASLRPFARGWWSPRTLERRAMEPG